MGEKSRTSYFMECKRAYAEFNSLLPVSTDINVQHSQREQLAIMSFLVGLPPRFDMAKYQVLSGSKISSLEEAYTRVLHIERSQIVPSSQSNSDLVGRTNEYQGNRRKCSNNQRQNSNSQKPNLGEVVCHYCNKLGHTKHDYRKLLNKGRRTQSDDPKRLIKISSKEFANFQQYQDSLAASSSNPTIVITESGSDDEEDHW
ncbi:uncharacterized protein LOC111009263 isoform X1 [Momordica charantia]|uniref:Uncharacterized protein LOC111009263 isoform X1 n=1 Tax=Momordica charantia TaxID=3673 RepID=A0A6J1C9T8_MOMCH|nr:uncharacterized protein LOC111009263 isoform X1 [Momordica charantia]